jgi:hypothetical protein
VIVAQMKVAYPKTAETLRIPKQGTLKNSMKKVKKRENRIDNYRSSVARNNISPVIAPSDDKNSNEIKNWIHDEIPQSSDKIAQSR